MRHIDRIQKYLDGEMAEEELKKFRDDLQSDPELVQELDLHRSLGEIIISQDEERFRKKLNEAYKTYKIKSKDNGGIDSSMRRSKILKKAIPYISLITVLIVVLFFYGNRKETNYEIFNKYLLPYNKELASRERNTGEQKNSNLEQGVNLYFQSNYSEASQQFNYFLNLYPDNIEAHFYNGLCYIYLNEFESAITSFDFVLHESYNYYQEYANWYLALCYIRTNNNETAKILLQQIAKEKSFFSGKAKTVLGKLK
jgi:TolA-binding protein